MTTKTIEISWDEDARVWFIAKSEIPGLTSEASRYEAVMESALAVIPKLVAINRVDYEGDYLRVKFTTEQIIEYPLLGG